MKRFTCFEALPAHARYIGSEYGGTLDERAADILEQASEPAYIEDDQGDRSFFDLAP